MRRRQTLTSHPSTLFVSFSLSSVSHTNRYSTVTDSTRGSSTSSSRGGADQRRTWTTPSSTSIPTSSGTTGRLLIRVILPLHTHISLLHWIETDIRFLLLRV